MFQEGQQIGSYKLLRKLGKGGFGEVWLAEKRSQFVTKKVAVKLPLDEQINLDAIRREAELWEQASGHANVLPIIDADVVDNQVIIVSEYADGGSLHDRLKTQGKLPIKQAVEMTIGILNGLEFLHHRKILHRDIKPQNILLQGSTPRLADFGISRAMQTTSISSKLVGTDAYMSPESFDGKRSVQTDIWSVGVVLYQLLAGNLPFPQEHPSERIFAILTKEFPPLPGDVPNSLQRIVAKALAKMPENRYQSANEMGEELKQALVGIQHPTLAKTEVLQIPISNQTVTDVSTVDKLFKTEEPKEEPKKETAVNNSQTPVNTLPPVQAKSIQTQFKQVNFTENKPLPTEVKKFGYETQNTRLIPLSYRLGIAAFLGIIVLIIVIPAIFRFLSTTQNISQPKTSSNVNSISTAPMNIELFFFEGVPLTVKVDGKSDTPSGSTKFTAQNNFTIEYSVYQVDKFQLIINGKVIKLSKTPPLGSYTSKFEVTKDNLNQVLQNGTNVNSSVSNSNSPAEMNIQLKTTAVVFFNYVIDGKDDITYVAESWKNFHPKQSFKLKYDKGYADNVELIINNQTIALPKADQARGKSIEFEITKDNLNEILQSGKVTQSAANH